MSSDDDIDDLVHYLCVAPQTARYGPYRVDPADGRWPRGLDLIVGRLRRYRLIDGEGKTVELHVYVGLGEIGGLLWEQEVRVLLRLGSSGQQGLPLVLDGGYEDAATTAKASSAVGGVALVATRGADHSLADDGAATEMRSKPLMAVKQFLQLCEALAEIHDMGGMHRNLVPAAILADLSADTPALWIGRFEMSALLGNLLRRTVDSEVSTAELRALFLSDPAAPDDRVLVCQPFERMRFLFPEEVPEPLLESPEADVYSLAATVWDWFCEPEVLTAQPLPESPVERHRELHGRMVAALGPAGGVPARLATTLSSMLDPVARNRPTIAQVCRLLVADLDAIRLILAADERTRPYLVVDIPREAAPTLIGWGLIKHGADTPEGLEELSAFMTYDLTNVRVALSPRGAEAFVRSGENAQDKMRSRTVLLGRNCAWFCQYYQRKTWGKPGQPLETALIIKYVAQREHPGNRRAFEDLVRNSPLLDVPAVDVVSMNVAASVMDQSLVERPSWKEFLDQLGSMSPESAQDLQYGSALDWLLAYQGAELSARTYGFTRTENSTGQVVIEWDQERERRIHNADALLTKFSDSPWLRPALGDFFRSLDDESGESKVEILKDLNGRPVTDVTRRSVWIVDTQRVGIDRLWLRRDQGSEPIPERGWIRPLSDTGTRTALHRQVAARSDLMRTRGLLAQLRKPWSIRTLPNRWTRAMAELKDTLKSEESRKVVGDMLTYRPFFAIQGPPGTGKTTLVSEAVNAYLREEATSRVLISAQSGFALDNLAQRVLQRLGEIDADGEPTNAMEFIALRVTSHSGTPPNPQIMPWTRDELAERTAERIRKRVDEVLADCSPEQSSILSVWRRLLDPVSGENILPELGDRVERAADLVFATCVTATAETVTPGGTRSRFDWVIVEEAAKAWPTELAMPLAAGTAWTLIGDHKQLGAHRRSDFERFLADCANDPSPELAALADNSELYLDTFDTFRRLFDALKDDSLTQAARERLPLRELTHQFRMRDPIAQIVSRVFYPSSKELEPDGLPRGQLRTGREVPHAPVQGPPDLVGQSVVWLDTRDVPDCADEGHWFNQGEARIIAKLVERLQPEPEPRRHGYSSEPLAILSPYRQQAQLLKQYGLVRDFVSTIHAFQGREADIVMVSLVRQRRHGPAGHAWSSLGHLTQRNLINVMTSRARKLLIIVGSFDHFANVDAETTMPAGPDEEDRPFWGRLCTAVQLYGQVLSAAEVIDG
ncbi:AAA domain-containing protein [Catenuloplanes japonicus]|uniref:AAA domain-containing protein n=1 Tax=Catenuloplanes japonicus TaxID=33876 RepID=UPI000525E6D7|nr:AAA domain-containing protein [Catenuloplanes japonicus]